MPTVTLSGGQKLVVARKLERSLATAAVAGAEVAAQVGGDDREPAVVLIVGEELVLVGSAGTRRWPLAEIVEVAGQRILTRDGAVPIAGWWYARQAWEFRAALCSRIGQTEPAALPDPEPRVPPTLEVAREVIDARGRLVAWLGGTVVFAALASLASYEADWNEEAVVGISAVLAALLGLPLLVLSVKLVGHPSRWRPVGVAGIVVGLVASLMLVAAILLLIAVSGCDGNCIGGPND